MRVVDEAQHRPVLGELGQQGQHRHPDEQLVTARRRPELEGAAQRGLLHVRQVRHSRQAPAPAAGAATRTGPPPRSRPRRSAARSSRSRRRPRRRAGRSCRPRVTAHDQDGAVPGAGPVEHRTRRGPIGFPAPQHDHSRVLVTCPVPRCPPTVHTVRSMVELDAVTRLFPNGVTALDEVTVGFAPATFTAVMGPSGSGKSTLLQCAAGLDRPTSGPVTIGGTDLTGLSETRAHPAAPGPDRLRLPGVQPAARADRRAERRPCRCASPAAAPTAARSSGPSPRSASPTGPGTARPSSPAASSSGSRSPARWSPGPTVLFADEPTGALDSGTGRDVLRAAARPGRPHGQTIVMVTHDPVAAAYADRVAVPADGRCTGDLDVTDRRRCRRPDDRHDLIALASLRLRWVSFVGTFIALALGSALIAAMGQVLATTATAPDRAPQRYAAYPVVVAPHDTLTVPTWRGGDSEPLAVSPGLPGGPGRRAACRPRRPDHPRAVRRRRSWQRGRPALDGGTSAAVRAATRSRRRDRHRRPACSAHG